MTLKGIVYDFWIDCGLIDGKDMLHIQEYLMKKTEY